MSTSLQDTVYLKEMEFGTQVAVSAAVIVLLVIAVAAFGHFFGEQLRAGIPLF